LKGGIVATVADTHLMQVALTGDSETEPDIGHNGHGRGEQADR